jgi:hypothetical protein
LKLSAERKTYTVAARERDPRQDADGEFIVTSFLLVLVGLLVAPFVACGVACVSCALLVLRGHKPTWSCGLISAVAGVLTLLWAVFQADALHPSRWPGRIPDQWHSFLPAMVSSICLTAVVVLFVVVLFQERYRRHYTVSERRHRRQQRREKAWRRTRWLWLAASSGLMMGFTIVFLISLSGRGEPESTDVVEHYSAAAGPASGGVIPQEAVHAPPGSKPLLDLQPAAAFLLPLCSVGMLGSGFWFAYTVAYWRGYLRVVPRRRHDFLPSFRAPARNP